MEMAGLSHVVTVQLGHSDDAVQMAPWRRVRWWIGNVAQDGVVDSHHTAKKTAILWCVNSPRFWINKLPRRIGWIGANTLLLEY